ncbi:MAG TPA: hypothetical protein VI461_13220 [Chitinophagaceae bacterium]|nr:hypothetical protein [Chitinophagaceae bacterium]
MNDRLPYEEQLAQQWNDLPLPDEDMAWADMRRRLEEDDDGGIIPIWLRGCGLWGLLAIVLIGIGWLIIRPEKWWSNKQETENVNTTGQTEKKNNNTTVINANDISISVTGVSSKNKKTNDETKALNQRKEQPGKKIVKKNESEKIDIAIQQPPVKKKDELNTAERNDKPVVPADDSTAVAKTIENKKDSVVSKPSPDSTQQKTGEPGAKTSEPKKDSSKSKTISFSAGLGMHQLLPVAGQKITPYNSEGRKGSLADYIPSVFGRMYVDKKWFLQAEFRYGAPQYTKEFLYLQHTVFDTIGPINNHAIITSSKLKKTFYHQLPLTLNYFVLPNWSVGTGIVWNKFVSAVSQQEINRKNITTQTDSILSSALIRDKSDSLFKKSYFQAVFETQYRWKRLSIGAKYSFGLQPYIRFTLPGGTQQQEKNKSLQVFLRYELWKSKAKR